jgi:hypothetical protein
VNKLLPLSALATVAIVGWWWTQRDQTQPSTVGVELAPQLEDKHSKSPTALDAVAQADSAATTQASPQATRSSVTMASVVPADLELVVSKLVLGLPEGSYAPAPGETLDMDPLAVCVLTGRIAGVPVGTEVAIVSGIDAGRRSLIQADGSFELRALHPGRAVVRISAVTRTAERLVELTPSASTPRALELDFSQTGTAWVRVDDHFGRPVANAQVRVDGWDRRTDAEGQVRLTGAPLGDAWCEVRHGEHARLARAVPVSANPEQETELVLAPGAQIEVQVQAQLEESDELYIAVAPTLGRSGPTETQLQVPWWSYEPLRMHAGETAWIQQLPPGRYVVVPFVNGVRYARGSVYVDLPAGRLRTARIQLARPEVTRIAGPGCEPAPTLAWRTQDRLRKHANDFELEALAAGRLGLAASPGIAGAIAGETRGSWFVPRDLLDRGAAWAWTLCRERGSEMRLLGPSMSDYATLEPGALGTTVVELPASCRGLQVRVCVEGLEARVVSVPNDGSVDLGHLTGLYRVHVSGRTLEQPLSTTIAASSAFRFALDTQR